MELLPEIYSQIIDALIMHPDYNKRPSRNYGVILINHVCKLFQLLLRRLLDEHSVFIQMRYTTKNSGIHTTKFCG